MRIFHSRRGGGKESLCLNEGENRRWRVGRDSLNGFLILESGSSLLQSDMGNYYMCLVDGKSNITMPVLLLAAFRVIKESLKAIRYF